jgi:dTMP kinase
LPQDVIQTLNHFATGGLSPRRTFFFDVPPHVALARQNPDAKNHLDKEGWDFHFAVYQKFQEIASKEPHRVIPIDATRPASTVFAEVQALVASLLIPREPESL